METIELPNMMKDSKVLYLSTQSSSGVLLNGDYKSYVQYDIKSHLNFEGDNSIEYITMSVPYVSLTNSNYIVNEYNNTLYVAYPNVSSNFITIQFPVGNYTSSSLINTFKSLLAGFSIALDPLTKKLVIGYDDEFVFGGASTIDYILGFDNTQTATYGTSSILGFTGYILTMPRVINLLPLPRFLIRCEEINCGLLLNTQNQEQTDILASVPNISKNNSNIVFENNTEEFLIRNNNISTLTIRITDENSNLVNFNGISSYFCLRFNIYRKSIKRPLKFEKLLEQISNTNSIFAEKEVLANIPTSPDEIFRL